VLGISGASREMTEGVTALLAAVMLLYVGYWLHNKSYAAAWSSFIRTQVNAGTRQADPLGDGQHLVSRRVPGTLRDHPVL
jgi:high-affinity Fe2+/Pb2+ permease